MVWKAVVYADTKESHLDAWAYLLEQFPEQEAIISYIIHMWPPWRRQFVSCWTSEIRNFGVRVTSRTEANRREIKGYLNNSSADLKHLVERVELMVSNCQCEYEKQESDEASRQLNDYRTHHWMGDTHTRCSRHALKLLLDQYRIAVAVTKESRPSTACTGRFKQQFGIPCSHTIKQKEEMQTPLSYHDIHPHWHLGRDLQEEDQLRYILDPIIILSSRGRPQLRPEEIPTALIPRGTNRRRQAAAARAREPSEWEIEEAHARERQREVAARFQQQQRECGGGHGRPHTVRAFGSRASGASGSMRGGRGHSGGTGRGLRRQEIVGGASQGTAGQSGMTDEVLAELERDIKADLARWGCEEVAALLEPAPAEE